MLLLLQLFLNYFLLSSSGLPLIYSVISSAQPSAKDPVVLRSLLSVFLFLRQHGHLLHSSVQRAPGGPLLTASSTALDCFFSRFIYSAAALLFVFFVFLLFFQVVCSCCLLCSSIASSRFIAPLQSSLWGRSSLLISSSNSFFYRSSEAFLFSNSEVIFHTAVATEGR